MALPQKSSMYGLEKFGFERAKKEPPKRVVMSIFGQEGTGKNTFAFTMPKPIALIDMEMGFDRAKLGEEDERDWLIKKTIFVSPALETAKEYADKWQEFLKVYDAVLKSGVPSIVVDTASAVWELLRLAQFGKLTQVMPIQYNQIKPTYKALLQKARKEGTSNVMLIHRAQDEYASVLDPKTNKPVKNPRGDDALSAPTGALKRNGYGDTGYEVDVELAMYMEGGVRQGSKKKWSRTRGNVGEDAVWGCEVLKSGFGVDGMVGERFEGEGICTFPFVMGQLTGVDDGRWGGE